MYKSKVFIYLSTLVLAVLFTLVGSADAKYPNKPIKVILATGAGGSHDMHCRAVASVIHEHLGQPFLCTVRGGGGGKNVS